MATGEWPYFSLRPEVLSSAVLENTFVVFNRLAEMRAEDFLNTIEVAL